MQKLDFPSVVDAIMQKDSRYNAKAYSFVREGLDQTLKATKRHSNKNGHRHVTGPELLEGLRHHTLKEFGPMGKMVLNEWGIATCADFGEIVFNLVNYGVLGKSEDDRIEDFSEIWSFDEAFVKPFEPSSSSSSLRHRSERKIKPVRLSTAKKTSPKKKSSSSDELSSL